MSCLLASTAAAQSVEGFTEIRVSSNLGVDGTPWNLVERARPTFETELGSDRLMLQWTLETALVQGRQSQKVLEQALNASDLGPFFDLAGCEWPTGTHQHLAISNNPDLLSLERVYVDWYHPNFDLRVGRQPLNWGSAQFTNPTDPYPQVLLTEPWKPRQGVNAARLTVPIGDGLNQIQAVVGTDNRFQKVRAAARGTVNVAQTDFSVISAYRQESDELLTGIDIRGNAVVGFWFEGSVHARKLFIRGDGVDVSEELAMGIDYSFPIFQNFVVGAQYYRNGAGATDPSEYDFASRASQGVEAPQCDQELGPDSPFGDGSGTVDPFAPFFSAQNYGLVSVNAVLTTEFSLSTAMLQNFDDGTGTLIPTLTLSPFGSTQIALSGQIPYKFWGEGGEFKPNPADLALSMPSPLVVGEAIDVDLSGLVPDATLTLWTRTSF